MLSVDSKHTRSRHKIRAQQEQETFEVVNRRQRDLISGNNLWSRQGHANSSPRKEHFNNDFRSVDRPLSAEIKYNLFFK